MKVIFVGLVVSMLACAAGRASAQAQDIGVDASKVYFGNKEGDKPATVRAADCFAIIPEWKEIQRRKLDHNEADYWILLRAANSKFRKAVEAVATAKSYDLVAEEGSVEIAEGEEKPPDETAAVLAALKLAEEAKK